MMKQSKSYSVVQYIFWIIAGSEISVLKKCPNDYNRHANIGIMIFITSLFAGITSFIAGKTFVKDNNWGIFCFSIVWAFLIFSLDRSMVNSIKKNPDAPDKSLWGYFYPRLGLAIILSFFMSIPLDHIVFKEKIEYQMDKDVVRDWGRRQLELQSGLNVFADSAAIINFNNQSDKMENELNAGCAECPLDDYKVPKKEADRINDYEIPGLLNSKNKTKKAFDNYFEQLRRYQTPDGEKLINSGKVSWNTKLKSLKVNKNTAILNYNNKVAEMNTLITKANQICAAWKQDIRLRKVRIDSLKIKTEDRLIVNTDSVRIQSGDYKKELTDMRGFDTQFVTLFLMPNWGVQILKWLIFLALLVIEILPTFLKLKTPIGQYDWEMYKNESETELEVKAKIESLKTGIKDIEDYRMNSEIELNKKLIDKIVIIEENLANEMLDDWEDKVRGKMKEDIDKSI